MVSNGQKVQTTCDYRLKVVWDGKCDPKYQAFSKAILADEIEESRETDASGSDEESYNKMSKK